MTDLTATNIIVWVAVGGLFGWIADAAFNATRLGTVGNIAVGIVGAYLGTWLTVATRAYVNVGSPFLNLVLTSFLGAVVLLAAVAAFEKATS
ncbi:MAG: GlsB/YeaQ/YmgE family stress response membrane protein [Anaerolineae bacterium]